jgi:hypothetical protein
MIKELIHIWCALCFAATFEVTSYLYLQNEYRSLKKRVIRLESVTFDSARCPKDA